MTMETSIWPWSDANGYKFESEHSGTPINDNLNEKVLIKQMWAIHGYPIFT